MQTALSLHSQRLSGSTGSATWKARQQQHQSTPMTCLGNSDDAAIRGDTAASHPHRSAQSKVRYHADPQIPRAMIDQAVEISPPGIVARRAVAGHGMGVEIVQATRPERTDVHFCAPVNLLVVGEEGVRRAGKTSVEGLAPSALRDVRRKLTFVPAGHAYHDWQEPHTLSRMIYFYFDLRKLQVDLELDLPELSLEPRLFFENAAVWETALKLRLLIEESGGANRLHFEALGVVLAHELVGPHVGASEAKAPIKGGLAAWQQRLVIEYLDAHVSEHVSLAELARLARLSPHHFCRAFKQSLGVPPHRYHNQRRIERAKTLLAKPNLSVTAIAFDVGFSEASSFSAAFRKLTGCTPTTYRRSLA